MKLFKYVFFISLSLLSSVFTVHAQQERNIEVPRTSTFPGIENPDFPYAQPEEVGLSSDKLNRLGDEITSWVANGELVGGELLIIKDGRTAFHEAYGWSDLADKKPVEPNSIWSIRSMTKPFTATAIMILVEDGKLSLDDRVLDYISGFKGYPETTIAHLMSHTSGYSGEDFSDYDSTHQALKDWVMSGATKDPTGMFGEYEYTDFGFVASAYIIEKISGISLKEFIEQHIIIPLGLKNTSVNFSDDPEWRSKISTWYILNQETGKYEVRWPSNREGWRIFGGAWGMFSTVTDYAKFLSCFLNNGEWNNTKLLKKENVSLMTQAQGFSKNIPMYGYGWMVQYSHEDNKAILNFGHRGGDALAGYVFPQKNLIIIYMSHSRGGYHRAALMEKLNELELIKFTNYVGSPVKPKHFQGKTDQLTEKEQKRFLGIFKESKDTKKLLEITSNNGFLSLNLFFDGYKTRRKFDLVYLGNNKFAFGEYAKGKLDWLSPDVLLDFTEQEGTLNSFKIKQNDQTVLTAYRED